MPTMNSKMFNAYSTLSPGEVYLDESLREVVTLGFIGQGGCIFLRRLLDIETNAKLSDFPDKTGYECFINSLNVDDYVDRTYLEQALSFVYEVLAKWNDSSLKGVLVSILSMDEFGVKVKFHMRRPGESWLSENLEGYEESIMLIESSELNEIRRYKDCS